jgi:hypothetical protein
MKRGSSIRGADMRTRVNISSAFITEYRRVLNIMKEGGDPPCVRCSNLQVVTCAKTGYQCEDFAEYVGSLSESLRMFPKCDAGIYHITKN